MANKNLFKSLIGKLIPATDARNEEGAPTNLVQLAVLLLSGDHSCRSASHRQGCKYYPMIALETQTASYTSIREIDSIVHGFQWCTLPRERWTHAAHLAVALWYHLRLRWPHAEKLIRSGIQRFNAAHGIVNTPTGGYHETMTLFWIALVRLYLEDFGAEKLPVLKLYNNLIERCGRKELPFEYYSRELLFSAEARASWVEPDLKALRRP